MPQHLQKCLEIMQEVRKILLLPADPGPTNAEKFCYLFAVIENQGKGTKGAGLTGGIFKEALWKDMLTEKSELFCETPVSQTAITADADYYFQN